jgi:ribosomal protein L3 glutamine methyltransferase
LKKKNLAYLIKQAWFAGLIFQVDERVLIPRSPIAELINKQFYSLLYDCPGEVLDLCTGCGCIGIATADAFPDAHVDIADISSDALVVAELNIQFHQLDSRVNIIESDLFSNIVGKYDLILCNPPYVSTDE